MTDDWLNESDLWVFITDQFALGKDSIHGPWHWKRVEKNALELAEESGADILVVRLFAVFHDSKRRGESYDRNHGLRGAEFAQELRGQFFDLADERMKLLVRACEGHEKGKTSSDATIGTCWDADRLDLPRVGITPWSKYMSTEAGRRRTK